MGATSPEYVAGFNMRGGTTVVLPPGAVVAIDDGASQRVLSPKHLREADRVRVWGRQVRPGFIEASYVTVDNEP